MSIQLLWTKRIKLNSSFRNTLLYYNVFLKKFIFFHLIIICISAFVCLWFLDIGCKIINGYIFVMVFVIFLKDLYTLHASHQGLESVNAIKIFLTLKWTSTQQKLFKYIFKIKSVIKHYLIIHKWYYTHTY